MKRATKEKRLKEKVKMSDFSKLGVAVLLSFLCCSSPEPLTIDTGITLEVKAIHQVVNNSFKQCNFQYEFTNNLDDTVFISTLMDYNVKEGGYRFFYLFGNGKPLPVCSWSAVDRADPTAIDSLNSIISIPPYTTVSHELVAFNCGRINEKKMPAFVTQFPDSTYTIQLFYEGEATINNKQYPTHLRSNIIQF